MQKEPTKQQVLDMQTTVPQEMALQNALLALSKTRLEQIRRMLNELNTVVFYKTQLRSLPFSDIVNTINKAVAINQQSNE